MGSSKTLLFFRSKVTSMLFSRRLLNMSRIRKGNMRKLPGISITFFLIFNSSSRSFLLSILTFASLKKSLKIFWSGSFSSENVLSLKKRSLLSSCSIFRFLSLRYFTLISWINPKTSSSDMSSMFSISEKISLRDLMCISKSFFEINPSLSNLSARVSRITFLSLETSTKIPPISY